MTERTGFLIFYLIGLGGIDLEVTTAETPLFLLYMPYILHI